MTTVETKNKPIEVWLSQPHLEITCRIVLHDGTAIGVGVDSPSLHNAQREMTIWLTGQGYEPAGQWSAKNGHADPIARTFRCRAGQPAAALAPAPRPVPPIALRHEPDRDPHPRPAPRAASRVRRQAAPEIPARRGPTHSPLAAETQLRAWARTHAERDDVIRTADAAGISLHRIHQITGITRTTILRILGSPPKPARPAPRKLP